MGSLGNPQHLLGAVGKSLEVREFVWTDADFSRVQGMIFKRAGISLQDGKHAMVYSRLSRRLRETGYRSFRDYLSWLETSDSDEWQEFINALTTNLTSFFREEHHFHSLAALFASRPPATHWNIWCSAASTGEEPFSIAITAAEALGSLRNVSLFASDIDSKVLSVAATGVYRLDGLKGITSERLKANFLRGIGRNEGSVRIKAELLTSIEYMIVNLIENDWPFSILFDVVFCRNVMIYFNGITQRSVLERLHRVMKPGGLLFVGHAENFTDSRDLFQLKGKTVYERL